MSCNDDDCNFNDWYYSCRPVSNQNINPVPNIQSVNYIIDYDIFNTQTPPIVYAPATNNPLVITFTERQPIYDARTYCSSSTNPSIGYSYYEGSLYPTGETNTFEGQYTATNIFTLTGFTYTIYKVGILRQVLSGTYDGTNYGVTVFPIEGGATIVTENVTGINIIQPNGKSSTSNAVKINNRSGVCSATGVPYTEYSIAYDASTLVQRPPPPPAPPAKN